MWLMVRCLSDGADQSAGFERVALVAELPEDNA